MFTFANSNEPVIPKAIQYIRHLYSSSPSINLFNYFSTLQTAKEITLEVLITGIQQFTKLANLNSDARQTFYGDKFFGLHYSNDLSKKWNNESPHKITFNKLKEICPASWDYIYKEGRASLIYKGDQPTKALNALLQGPTVIDCGMFCQLSIWFGIRYMLGDELFNQIFGKTPFYLTAYLYNDITNPLKPYLGNPLYPFFSTDQFAEEKLSDLCVVHVPNDVSYQLKHPGGAYRGNNCVVIRGAYTIFDADLPVTSDMKRANVEKLLREAFNEAQNDDDKEMIKFYETCNPDAIHPRLGMSFKELITQANKLANTALDEKACNLTEKKKFLTFNWGNFHAWLKSVMEKPVAKTDYVPLTNEQLTVPALLLSQIPFENREHMTFSAFNTTTPLQSDMLARGMAFCHNVMNEKSISLILTGKAGIGKTATAVCCAKELSSRGKNIIWISEVTVKGWMDKAKSVEALEFSRRQIVSLLKTNPDAVFLDDDNMIDYAGRVLLEEIYAWYVSHPGKGLFITSNASIGFEACYGHQLDSSYSFPPFPGYTSPFYQNTIIHQNLSADSLRPAPVMNITELTDDEKVTTLLKCQASQSAAVIVDFKAFEKNKMRLEEFEFIPGLPTLTPVRYSLITNGTLGSDYEKLTVDQKKWIRQFSFHKKDTFTSRYVVREGICMRLFEKSPYKLIAIEILQDKREVDEDCVKQLLRVVNYAHDKGGKRVIIINHTEFLLNDLLEKIKLQIPEREKERTISRLTALLFSSALADDQKKESTPIKPSTPTKLAPLTNSIFRPTKVLMPLNLQKKSKKKVDFTRFLGIPFK